MERALAPAQVDMREFFGAGAPSWSDFALDHLLLTCNDSEIGHVKEEAMFHYSDYGVDLGGDCVRIFDKKT